jgi:hypothetical protein
MLLDSCKTKSKRASSKNAEIEEMTSAVHGNESSFSRALEQERLENIDDIEDMSKQDGKRRRNQKTYYEIARSGLYSPQSLRNQHPSILPPRTVMLMNSLMRGRGPKKILAQTKNYCQLILAMLRMVPKAPKRKVVLDYRH